MHVNDNEHDNCNLSNQNFPVPITMNNLIIASSLINIVVTLSNRYNMSGRSVICMGFTRRAVVNLIQIGREYCILVKIRMHLNNYVNELFCDTGYFSRVNQS